MKKAFLWFVILGIILLPLSAMASTSADKQAAIDAGLAYLASTQNADGSWTNAYGGTTFASAHTGAALLAFVEQSYKPAGWNGADYSQVVTKATDYLLGTATTLPFAAAGNWWGFGAGGEGIRWSAAGEDTYITGIVLPALSRLVSNPEGGTPLVQPTAIISSTNSVVANTTYAQVIQGVVDSFTYYQTGPGSNKYGGWRYYAGPQDSDMSTTQWPVIGYAFADQVAGVTIPDGHVKTALQQWIAACQTPLGGVDYQPNYGLVDATHAGGFILSNLFAGGGGSLTEAVNWLDDNWLNGPSGTWYGNEGHPYAMWAVYKGLEALYGTEGAIPQISNLQAQTTALDDGAVWNWWEDYCQYLVGSQNPDGSWPGYVYWTGSMATAWSINILNATTGGEIPPPAIPEPATLVLLGSGLIGLAASRRKRMKK